MQTGLSAVMLGAVVWALAYLLPKARREHDTFAIVCSLLTAVVALLGWLLVGIGVR